MIAGYAMAAPAATINIVDRSISPRPKVFLESCSRLIYLMAYHVGLDIYGIAYTQKQPSLGRRRVSMRSCYLNAIGYVCNST